MCVVVDERDPVDLAAELEPPRDTAEAAHRVDGRLEWSAELEGESGGAGRVGGVVASGDGKVDGAELRAVPVDSEAAPPPVALVRDDAVRRVLGEPVRRGAGMGCGESSCNRVVGAHDAHARDGGDELLERGRETGEAAVMIEMIGLDVGDHARLRRQLEKGAVALVGFDDEPLPFVVRGVGADLVEVAADDEAGTPTRGAQDERQHRRRGRLAVTAGDGDCSMCGGKRAQRVGAPEHGQAAFDGRADFGVRVGDGRRHHHRVGVGRNVLGVVSDVGTHPEEAESVESP